MTVSDSLAGALQLAAALAFHLPGARLDLSGAGGTQCVVGPLTSPRSTLHPAEFREMIVAGRGSDLLESFLGGAVTKSPMLSLDSSIAGVQNLGGGLYRVASDDGISYAFATPLQAGQVDAVLSGLHSEILTDNHPSRASSQVVEDETIGVSLVQDDGLGVTLVVLSSSDSRESLLGKRLAQEAVSACLVAEMEHFGNSSFLREDADKRPSDS